MESDPQITHGSDKGSERHKRGMERTNMEKPTMSTKIEKIFYPKIFKKIKKIKNIKNFSEKNTYSFMESIHSD